ncbi:MAG: hypothetical protein ACLRMZ_08810 [Blautia marasmi]
MKGLTIPTVMIERPADVYEVEKVLVDNTEGSYIATERLLAAGHRKIVYLGRESEEPVEQERYHGYVQAMRGVDDAYVQRHSYFTQEYTVEHGFMKCMEILEKMGRICPLPFLHHRIFWQQECSGHCMRRKSGFRKISL